VLDAWAGRVENTAAAQAALLARARMNGLARRGRWSTQQEPALPQLTA
jgi:fructose-bisphosphate aldolase class I